MPSDGEAKDTLMEEAEKAPMGKMSVQQKVTIRTAATHLESRALIHASKESDLFFCKSRILRSVNIAEITWLVKSISVVLPDLLALCFSFPYQAPVTGDMEVRFIPLAAPNREYLIHRGIAAIVTLSTLYHCPECTSISFFGPSALCEYGPRQSFSIPSFSFYKKEVRA
jgi:hypothetical protein